MHKQFSLYSSRTAMLALRYTETSLAAPSGLAKWQPPWTSTMAPSVQIRCPNFGLDLSNRSTLLWISAWALISFYCICAFVFKVYIVTKWREHCPRSLPGFCPCSDVITPKLPSVRPGCRFHETPRNLRFFAGEIVHRPRCELRRIMRRKSSCDASQRFVKSTTGHLAATYKFITG